MMKIFTRLLLLFFLVAVLPLALLGYFNLRQNEDTLRADALGRVGTLADKKVMQVRGFLAERQRNVRFLAQSPMVRGGVDRLAETYPQRSGAAYAGEDGLMRQYFDRYVKESGVFYDIFLITPQGEVIFTHKHESDFATNLLDGPWRNTQLAEVFRDARMTLEPAFSRQEIYGPTHDAALFIAAPVMKDGKFKGVLAAQLSNAMFFKVASDAVGLGQSGEAVFGRKDGEYMVMATPLRYHLDGREVLRLKLDESRDVPMYGAIFGQSGENVKKDYRGVRVVSAWRYLPELDWAMVVKMDEDEVFASISRQRTVTLELVLALLFLSGLLAYYFARQISAPLESLARTADEMAKGSLDQRVDESAFGELGLFAKAFNRMAVNLQGIYGTLEDRIEERTQELNASNAKLHEEIAARKEAEEEIRSLAFYDVLTGLPNRRLLMDRLSLALSLSQRSRQFGAVLFLDMDNFKTLNDTLGHDYGDLMLVEVAERIKSCVRDADTVARFGGDEFVVLLEDVDVQSTLALEKIALIAEKIREILALPYLLSDREHHSSPSIGVSLYLGHEESIDSLLKHADMAMYEAKAAGKNTVRFFDPAMQKTVEAHAVLERDLRFAITGGQLCLHYQAQMDSNLKVSGAEALVRWMHPVRGMVFPGEFIPLAEEGALIFEIGEWVLDTACRQLVAWQSHAQNLSVSVNVSAQQFKRADFVERVAAVLRAHQVETSGLKLELTESVVLSDAVEVADVVAKMRALKELGVKLSLEDFGTGYSSLSYLKQLPLDQIKIDQSFVRHIATDSNDAVMIKTIIDLAQNFDLDVIAEGVETEDQLVFLKQHGCKAYQGYLFGRPVPIEEFDKLLERC